MSDYVKSENRISHAFMGMLRVLLALVVAFAFSGISVSQQAAADEAGSSTHGYTIKYICVNSPQENPEIADEQFVPMQLNDESVTVSVDSVKKDILGYSFNNVTVQGSGSGEPHTSGDFIVNSGDMVFVNYDKITTDQHSITVDIQCYKGDTLAEAQKELADSLDERTKKQEAWIGDEIHLAIDPTELNPFGDDYEYSIHDGSLDYTLDPYAESTTCGPVKIYYVKKAEEQRTYTTTYNLNGGSSTTAQLSYTVNEGAATPTIANPTRDGYVFKGWSPSIAAIVTTDVTYTAQWEKKAEPKPTMHNVSYTVNYVGLASAQMPYTRTVAVATDITTVVVQAADISKAFSGYKIASVKLANGTAVAAGSKVPNGSVITVTYEKVQKPGSWVSSGSRWWYRYTDGTYPTNEWIKVGGKSYHFDAAGWMQTGWLQLGSTWYFLNDSGAMTTGWQYVGGAWYFMDSDGKMRTGWIDDKGSRYYLSGTGAMVTGWKFLDNVWYYFNGSGAMTKGWQHVGGAWYHLGTDGKMLTGWKQDGSAKYYLSGSGAMITGWKYLDNAWYYFNGSGAMTKGWQYVGGAWYHMASNGKMQTGWYESNGIKYYISNSGAMVTGWRTIDGVWYYFKASGAMVKNAWVGNYWLGSDGKMAKDTWVDNDTYYVDANGAWVKGKRR